MTESNGEDGARGVKVPGKEALHKPLPKRFYKAAGVAPADKGFRVVLDGRGVKTPGKRDLAVPSRALAEAIAAEWNAQGDLIDPATMPLTRIVNSAIDGVAAEADAVAADIAAYGASDLLCYRAPDRDSGLAARQEAAWAPVLAWARDALGARLVLTEGVMPVAQSAEARERIDAALAGLDPFRLAALHVMTTLTGSALLALAHARGRLGRDEAWAAAHVDEDWQNERWGVDAEAEARRKRRREEFDAASRLLDLLGKP